MYCAMPLRSVWYDWCEADRPAMSVRACSSVSATLRRPTVVSYLLLCTTVSIVPQYLPTLGWGNRDALHLPTWVALGDVAKERKDA